MDFSVVLFFLSVLVGSFSMGYPYVELQGCLLCLLVQSQEFGGATRKQASHTELKRAFTRLADTPPVPVFFMDERRFTLSMCDTLNDGYNAISSVISDYQSWIGCNVKL